MKLNQQTHEVTVGSYWADNKIWMLGRVVKITKIDGEYAEVEVTNEPRQDRGMIPGKARKQSMIGRKYRIKTDRFRPHDRPRHGFFLPAKGPHDGLENIVSREPEQRGLPAAQLLRLKYDNGWTICTYDKSGKALVVDYAPRRKGDTRAWRAGDGSRYASTACHARIPKGIRVEIGQTGISDGRNGYVAYDTHIMVDTSITSCGITADPPHYGPVSPLERCTICEECEAEHPEVAMALRVNERAETDLFHDYRQGFVFREARSALDVPNTGMGDR